MKALKAKTWLALSLSAALLLSLGACGKTAESSAAAAAGGTTAAENTTTAGATSAAATTATGESSAAPSTAVQSSTANNGGTGVGSVNVGITNEVPTLNPLLQDGTETAKYATGLCFLPLVELDKDNHFVPMLAESVTTEDQQNFIVKLNPAAKWSDGQAITADDLIFTVLRLTSKAISNPSMSTWAAIKGLDDSGTHPDEQAELEGVVKVDELTVKFVSKATMPLNTFQNTFARYLMTVPKHVLGGKSAEELKTSDWFSHPNVVSGPYRATDFDGAHFVSYDANAQYWKGAPQIAKLNFKVVPGSQLLIGLKTGDIDFVQPTMASFPQEDVASLEELGNVHVAYDKPLTNQLIFLNTQSFAADQGIPKAILRAIDRESLVRDFLGGHGEVVDGFLTSASPYFDASLKPVAFSMDEAKAQLTAEIAWEKPLVFKVNSGDPTFVQAVNLIVQNLEELNIPVKVQTEDVNTLLTSAQNHDFDLLAVQYTLAPADPYPDVAWLMTGENWTQYNNPKMDALVAETQTAQSDEDLRRIYGEIDRLVQADVPMINAYVISPLGAVGERLENADPSVYGAFNNVEQWKLK